MIQEYTIKDSVPCEVQRFAFPAHFASYQVIKSGINQSGQSSIEPLFFSFQIYKMLISIVIAFKIEMFLVSSQGRH